MEDWTVELVLDCRERKSVNDFYDALLAAVGAPPWHGKNLDALNDSIVFGGINKVDSPIRFRNLGALPDDVHDHLCEFIKMIEEARPKS